MKIYAHYDMDGNINSLVADGGDKGLKAMLTPQPGLSVAEVTGVKLVDARDTDGLRKAAEANKIIADVRPLKLSKKG